MHYRMFGMGYVQEVFMNMGPYAAGAASMVALSELPLPGFVYVVPPSIVAGGAGYMVASRGEDQACAALKGVAGGVGAMMVLGALARS